MMELAEAKKAWAFVAPEKETELVDDGMRPRKCGHVRFLEQDGVVCEVDAVWRSCFVEEEDGRQLRRLLPHLHGEQTIAEICSEIGMEIEKGREVIQSLYEFGLVVSCGDTPMPAMAFQAHAVSVGKMWQQKCADAAGLSTALASDGLTRHLLLGHLVNLYHYVASAASHISPAILAAPNERLRLMLSEYLSEEYWHGVTLAEGLEAAGLTPEAITASQPLPAIQGVISFERQLALTDFLSYFIALGMNEVCQEDEPQDIRARWQRLEDMALLPPETIAPFRDHEVLDREEAHVDLTAEAFVDLAPLSRAQQESIFKTSMTLARMQGEAFAAVLRHYGDPSTPTLVLPTWD